MQSLLAQRDQMITLLARADPAVAERLADTYVSYPAGGGDADAARPMKVATTNVVCGRESWLMRDREQG